MNKQDIDNIEAAASRGACYLDERDPGWALRIDVDNLDMWSLRSCILGQLSGKGSYSLGAQRLGIDAGPYPCARGVPLSIWYGFNLPVQLDHGFSTWEALDQAWTHEILTRVKGNG
jgi:hypothetical protein